jgi:5-oxoprolinase (ATP-hydrolysing)
LLDEGIKSLAIVFMHAYSFPYHEQFVAKIAEEMGFSQISCSSTTIPMVRIVPRFVCVEYESNISFLYLFLSSI